MSVRARLASPLSVVVLAVAACTGGGAVSTGSPAVSSPAASSPAPGSPGPAAETYWLRMTTWQAIPPLDQFASQPPLVITGSGTAVVPGPVPAIYPGPLLPNLIGRPISEAGRAAIVQAARDLGLLNGTVDFSDPNGLMGAMTGRLELTVDGDRVTLTGSPDARIECITAPCDPPPGTPAAFGELWRRLLDLPAWLPAELGAETPYDAPAYALLVGPAPEADPGLPQPTADWPLAQPLGLFGGPVANGTARCGTASGADADALRPALAAASQLTSWVDASNPDARYGLVVRPLVPGEDACAETFGG